MIIYTCIVLFLQCVMCILFIKLFKAAKPGEFKLILASNRDEFFKRPGKTAHFWEEDGNIFGGRDMTEHKQGGTWLAMSKKGKIGILLNVSGTPNPNKLGRGFLVANYLKSPLPDREYLEFLMTQQQRYNAFHLVTAVLGSPQPNLYHYSNEVDNSLITEVKSDVFALSNTSLKKPFRKVVHGQKKFQDICTEFGRVEKKTELLQELLSFLKWEEKHYPDEVIDSLTHLPLHFKPHYSAVFVKSPDMSYGTRTHTVILVDWENKVEFHEWTLEDPITPEHMNWKETHEEFTIAPDTSLYKS